MIRDRTSFGYRLSKTADGLTWTTFDLAGKVAVCGDAPTKAVAAACIVRALARASAPLADAA